MSRKLIIDGNAVYEIDEQCMLRRKLEENAEATKGSSENKKGTANKDMKKDLIKYKQKQETMRGRDRASF